MGGNRLSLSLAGVDVFRAVVVRKTAGFEFWAFRTVFKAAVLFIFFPSLCYGWSPTSPNLLHHLCAMLVERLENTPLIFRS